VWRKCEKKKSTCGNCGSELERHEEKDTDVAIATKLLELFFTNSCDTVMLVTGDTNVAPAVRSAQALFPKKNVCFAFPYRRKNKGLAQLVSKSLNIKKEHYAKHQLPDPATFVDGIKVSKPPNW
jgi:hypothetical protein